MKARLGPWFYSWCGVSAFYRSYLVNPVRLRVKVGDQPPVEGVTAITQNSDPFTYFSTKPVYVNEGIEIDNGTLSMAVLKRAAQRDMPTLLPRLFNQSKPAVRHRQIIGYEGVTSGDDRIDLRGPLRRPPQLPAAGRRRLHRRAHQRDAGHRLPAP